MIPEDRAARIVWRLLAPEYSWEQYERRLVNQRHPEWNQAVAFVADEIRKATQEILLPDAFLSPERQVLLDAVDELDGDLAKLEAGLWKLLEEAEPALCTESEFFL